MLNLINCNIGVYIEKNSSALVCASRYNCRDIIETLDTLSITLSDSEYERLIYSLSPDEPLFALLYDTEYTIKFSTMIFTDIYLETIKDGEYDCSRTIVFKKKKGNIDE